MSWDRPTLKAFAKNELRFSYWTAFLVCVVGGFIGDYASGGSARLNLTINTGSNRAAHYLRTPHMLWHEFLLLLPIIAVAVAAAIIYSIFVAQPVRVGMARFFTQSPMGDRQFANLFWGFSGGHYLSIVKTMFVTNLVIGVGYLFFVIPGVIFQYKYCMVPYILAQEPHLDTREVMQLSDQMTRGDKLNIFVLDLSFIGWYLLGALFFGIGMLFVAPYVEATYAQLYGALTFKAKGTDPYGGAHHGGYEPHSAGGAYDPGGYRWGDAHRPGDDTPPSRSQAYTPPPPPPYGSHRYGPDEKQPPEENPWDKKGL